MIASRFKLETFLAPLLAGVLSIPLVGPAQAWDSTTDSLRVCNTNKSHDVVVAVVTKAVPWGIAALIASGWRRQGWWEVPAGRCQHTVQLQDVQSYEIWVYVQVIGGSEIQWPTSKEVFCIHETDAFETYAYSKEELQKCGAGESLETFSYMTSIDNLDDNFSIFRVENVTVNLDFIYEKSANDPAQPPTAQASTSTAPQHPDIGKLVQTQIAPARAVVLTLRLWKLGSAADDAALIDQYASRLDQPSDYEILTCTYNEDIVDGEFRRTERTFWHNNVHPDYLELIRQLTTREDLARIFGVRAVSACPASLDEATEALTQNAKEAANLR
ncbi:MAG: DUF1036 domain-containing protein [Parvibaculum sp.]|uniref:DUF1036 domain-containing protein n=1 Tax=Parvibaculum sp. TaxID=2024848 RepID=UPI003C74E966